MFRFGTATQDSAGQRRRLGRGWVRTGRVGSGEAVGVRCGWVRLGTATQDSVGRLGSDRSRSDRAGSGGYVSARLGGVSSGTAVGARQGGVWSGEARKGMAVKDWSDMDRRLRRSAVRMAVAARQGVVGLGMAR